MFVACGEVHTAIITADHKVRKAQEWSTCISAVFVLNLLHRFRVFLREFGLSLHRADPAQLFTCGSVQHGRLGHSGSIDVFSLKYAPRALCHLYGAPV